MHLFALLFFSVWAGLPPLAHDQKIVSKNISLKQMLEQHERASMGAYKIVQQVPQK